MAQLTKNLAPLGIVLVLLALVLAALPQNATAPTSASAESDLGPFPPALVQFSPSADNPLLEPEENQWDAKIRERGWILRAGDTWHLWYTGYRDQVSTRLLGHATSADGLKWTRDPANPLIHDLWVEDMMVVKQGDTYYMFAEGLHDQAQLLTSRDGVQWQPQGTLDVRYVNGTPLTKGPFGTPTAWLEDGVWHLFYERMDAGIWLAKSNDLKVWTNVQDEPVLKSGPAEHDAHMIALNQIVKHDGVYYAYYHGTGGRTRERVWNTNVARSRDLVHWEKYPGNPLVTDRSSGTIIYDGSRVRLYTTHEQVDVFFSDDASGLNLAR